VATLSFQSPLGPVRITGDAQGIQRISCLDEPLPPAPSAAEEATPEGSVPAPLLACREQLEAYCRGELRSFDLPLAQQGTPFQQAVWRLLLEVPFGETCSYRTLSRRYGEEKAIRAVAAANGRNPLWIVVPCHRIIGSNGELTGYAGGLWRKKWLLDHELSILRPSAQQLSLFG